MTVKEAKQEIVEYLRDADKAISMDEEYIHGWKSAMLVALEVLNKIPDITQCKDCEYRNDPKKCVINATCTRYGVDRFLIYADDWYCADAKPKELEEKR